MERPLTPLLDKMLEVQTKNQKLGELLEWLDDPLDYVFSDLHGMEIVPAEYFGVDLKEAEKERKALLEFTKHKSL